MPACRLVGIAVQFWQVLGHKPFKDALGDAVCAVMCGARHRLGFIPVKLWLGAAWCAVVVTGAVSLAPSRFERVVALSLERNCSGLTTETIADFEWGHAKTACVAIYPVVDSRSQHRSAGCNGVAFVILRARAAGAVLADHVLTGHALALPARLGCGMLF